MGGHVSWENMSYGRTCLSVGPTLREDMPYGVKVLLADISNRTCLMGGHILSGNMSCRRTCLVGGQVLWEDISYRRTCVIQEDSL